MIGCRAPGCGRKGVRGTRGSWSAKIDVEWFDTDLGVFCEGRFPCARAAASPRGVAQAAFVLYCHHVYQNHVKQGIRVKRELQTCLTTIMIRQSILLSLYARCLSYIRYY